MKKIIIDKSEIEAHRKHWRKIAKTNGWLSTFKHRNESVQFFLDLKKGTIADSLYLCGGGPKNKDIFTNRMGTKKVNARVKIV